jgi:cytochrome c
VFSVRLAVLADWWTAIAAPRTRVAVKCHFNGQHWSSRRPNNRKFRALYLPPRSCQKAVLAAFALVAVPIAAQAAPAPNSAIRGKLIFLRCAACHAVSSKAPPKVGPHLQGVVGRASGSVAGFTYSPAMRAAALRWDESTLDRWLTRPAGVVPGTSMVFAGLPNPDDRKAVIAYLKKPVP